MKVDTAAEKESWIGISDFSPRQGGHCESSAIMNALLCLGYDVNESMIAGGGAAPGFGFEEGTFPFLGARNQVMRELFFEGAGIGWKTRIPEGHDSGWPEIEKCLVKGIPVVLRVDMRFLPYRYGGKYGSSYMSFGWHMITLFAVEESSAVALVSDTELTELQRISLKDLNKARFSKTKVFPPKGEYYLVEDGPSGHAFDWDRMALTSVRNVLLNYECTGSSDRALIGLEGQRRYGQKLADIESYVRPKLLLPQVFSYMASNIEEFGTGGASFRILYRDFLRQAAVNSRFGELDRLLPLIDSCIDGWHALSGAFRKAAETIKAMSAAERLDLYGTIRRTADELYRAEDKFYAVMKEIYAGW